MSRAAPQTRLSAPSGRMPASITSLTMRWDKSAVAVAGLANTGTPASSATPAFSQSPQEGKLKALTCTASPRIGTARCMA